MALGKRATISLYGRKMAGRLAAAARRTGAVARNGAASGFAAAGRMQRTTLDLVFPAACASCEAELSSDAQAAPSFPICAACLEEMELIEGPTCVRCGAPLPRIGHGSDERPVNPSKTPGCARCRGRKVWFDQTIAAGLYSSPLRELVLRMKQSSGDGLSIAVGQLLWQQCGERLAAAGIDVVVPIPLHWRRRLVHQTNSAAILGEVLSRHLQRPFAERLLRRRRHTKPQASVTPAQRWQNVRQAFSARGGYHLNEAHVLLVDDILTTGATCSESARALRKAGAARVTVAVVARAIH